MEDFPEDLVAGAAPPEVDTLDEPAEEMPAGMERRLVLRLLLYWRKICGERDYPSFQDVDPSAIPSIWPNAFVLEVAWPSEESVYRIAGPDYAADCDQPLVGMKISQAPENSLVGKSVTYIDEVLEKGVPITRGGEFFRDNGVKVLYRSILLPMSDDGETISGLLGAANCREVADAE